MSRLFGSGETGRDLAWCAGFALLPTLAVVVAGGRGFGPVSVDMVWALSAMWGMSRGAGFHTPWLDAPAGQDLLTMAGGWTGFWLGGWLARAFGPIVAYNLVGALYLWLAGVGGYALARVAGVRRAWVAGLLLQLDPYLLSHLHGGRIEHAPIGLAALAVAAAILAWNGSNRAALAGGIAGAALVASGWELALILALAVPFGLAAALSCPPADGRLAGLVRGLAALLVATLLAGPLVWAYLHANSHSLPGFGRWLATSHTIGVIPSWGDPRPALPLLVAIPVWLSGQNRRVAAAIAAGVVVMLALALGPAPAWQRPISSPLPWDLGQEALDAATSPWAPFSWLAAVVPRYHWPIRLLAPLGIIGAVAAAGVADRLSGRWNLVIGAALAWTVIVDLPVLPRGRMRLAVPPPIAALARHEGSVLDLPLWQDAALHLDDQLHQIVHRHPIARSMQLFHLDPTVRPRLLADPVSAWFHALTGRAPPTPARFDRRSFDGWRNAGFGWVTLRRGPLPAARWAMARDALSPLGPPDLADGDGWLAWRLR